MTQDEKQIKDILVWVNHHRANRELDHLRRLPKGDRGRTDTCPVAKALSKGSKEAVQVAAWGWRKEGSGAWHPVPAFVADFCRRFDMGYAFGDYVFRRAS